MNNLTQTQARIIGVLIEKEATTPEQYPLTLNSLTTACNQKTNREPVTDFDETQVQEAIDQLTQSGLMMETRVGGRVPKFKHRFCNTEFSELKLSKQELGIICVLLLRGPQTPGELRTRTHRLCHFNDAHDVEMTLTQLCERNTPLVKILPRELGRREARYIQLFTEDAANFASNELSQESPANPGDDLSEPESLNKIEQLEARVNQLEEELEKIKDKIGDLLE